MPVGDVSGRPSAPWRLPTALCVLALLHAPTPAAADGKSPPRADRQVSASGSAKAARETAEERLARGRQAYLRNDFDGTVEAVTELLYPEVLLRSDEEVQAAHRLLALSHLFLRAEARAENEFLALLQLNPSFTLDAVADPPSAVAFLERLRRREAERVQELERRKREEAERIRRAEETQRAAEEARRLHEQEDRIRRSIKPVLVEKHSVLTNFVPFGTGQFMNRQRGKGIAFLSTQLSLALVSVGFWTAIKIKYEGGRIIVPQREWATVQALQAAEIGAGALFWADVVWGIVDALYYYRPDTVLRARGDSSPGGGGGLGEGATAPAARPPPVSVGPISLPGGAGISVGGTF